MRGMTGRGAWWLAVVLSAAACASEKAAQKSDGAAPPQGGPAAPATPAAEPLPVTVVINWEEVQADGISKEAVAAAQDAFKQRLVHDGLANQLVNAYEGGVDVLITVKLGKVGSKVLFTASALGAMDGTPISRETRTVAAGAPLAPEAEAVAHAVAVKVAEWQAQRPR